MTAPQTFRTRLAQALAVLVGLVGVAALAAFVGEDGPAALLRTAAPVALVVALGWALFWRPAAEISDAGITLVNVVRTVHIPWRRFRSADTRWALSITTDDERRYTAWAVPAGSGFGSRMVPVGRRATEFSPADGKLSSGGTAEAAALAIGVHLDATARDRAEGSATGEGGDAVTVTANRGVLAVLAALAVLTAVSVALG